MFVHMLKQINFKIILSYLFVKIICKIDPNQTKEKRGDRERKREKVQTNTKKIITSINMTFATSFAFTFF